MQILLLMKHSSTSALRWLAFAGLLTLSIGVVAQQMLERSSAVSHRHVPAQQPFDPSLVARLRVPSGFRVSVFATGLTDPRMMTVASDGTVYVTRWRSDDVIALQDTNGDKIADQSGVVARLDGVHGIELRGSSLYVASPTEVWTAGVSGGRLTSEPVRIISGLPDGGQHENRVIQFGPDGLLYVSVGSSCNDCVESNLVERATFIRYTAAGQRVDVFAKGLRNSIGFDWQPGSNILWAMDNGSDAHGDDTPPEELNRVEAGKHYGWPICYGARVVDPHTNDSPRFDNLRPGDPQPILQPITREQFCAQTEPAVLTYAAHAAPLWMQFYEGSQFPGYNGDAFIAFRGSWNRSNPVGYNVVRIRFSGATPIGFEEFLTGFLSADGLSYFGRPAGLAIAPDGSLLVSDDTNGVIYRVAFGN